MKQTYVIAIIFSIMLLFAVILGRALWVCCKVATYQEARRIKAHKATKVVEVVVVPPPAG